MTKKELLEALNYVDEDLIAEAAEGPHKKKKKGFRIPSAAAAVVVLTLGAGAAWGGRTIISQMEQMARLESQVAALEQEEKKTADAAESAETSDASAEDRVGIPDRDLGTVYVLTNDYGELYDALEAMGAKWDYRDAPAYAEGDVVMEEAAAAEAPAMDGGMTTASVSNEAKGEYSKTNLMTEGVDESDIVKTDGKYIYMVQSGSVRITDIRKGAPGDSVSLTIPFEAPSDRILEMYVDGSRLIVITSHAKKASGGVFARKYYGSNYENQTYAYTFDIKDPMKAKLLGSMHQDGMYHTSRKVGDVVYLFTNKAVRLPDGERSDALKEKNLTKWVPAVNDKPIASGCIWVPETGYNSLVVSTFRTDAPEKTIDAKVILNDYCSIYVGSENIYLYHTMWMDHQVTEITSFVYKDGKITAGAETTVSGGINDSFAIHEGDGTLQVLTTDYTDSVVNTLFVLDREMKLTGRIDEIARGEEIYAARYIGKMAYFITYENHDPLFVADLSDPRNPKLLGSLEISGFSDYLHLWDDTHILGIGYETDEQSNRQGMKLVMFDVSDPAHPKAENVKVIRLHEESRDRRDLWYGSDAVSGNYKAILAEPGKNLIGFGFEYSDWRSGEHRMVYPVLSYSKDKGFRLEQQIDMKESTGNLNEYRGLYSGDVFYLAGCGEIRAFAMDRQFDEIR